MLVAVALGLLGPQALASEDAPSRKSSRDRQAVAEPELPELARDVAHALEEDDAPYWTRLELRSAPEPSVDATEWARIEAEWERARTLIVDADSD